MNVRSGVWNPLGSISASQFVFPYERNSFSFVIATSVFTHLLSADAEHYIRQITNVLAPRGTLVGTFFLLNNESESLMAQGKTKFVFSSSTASTGHATAEFHRVLRQDTPEYAVAYPEEWVRQTLAGAGLASHLEVHPGGWCGRTGSLTGQDVVIARKVP